MNDLIDVVDGIVEKDDSMETFILITIDTEGGVQLGAPFDDENSIKQILNVALSNLSEFGVN